MSPALTPCPRRCPRPAGGVGAHTPPRPVCRHCRRCTVNRPRGLCWGCFYRPGVRELYPSTSKYARRGVGNIAGGLRPPDAPTTARPGTPGKLAVFEQRAEAGQALFHPADARF